MDAVARERVAGRELLRELRRGLRVLVEEDDEVGVLGHAGATDDGQLTVAVPHPAREHVRDAHGDEVVRREREDVVVPVAAVGRLERLQVAEAAAPHAAAVADLQPEGVAADRVDLAGDVQLVEALRVLGDGRGGRVGRAGRVHVEPSPFRCPAGPW